MKALLAAIVGCLCVAAQALEAGWHERGIDVGGQTRWVRIYSPASARASAPAVLLLHGGTQSMRKVFRDAAGGTRAWLDVADREGVVLIVPNGTNRSGGDAAGDSQAWNDYRVFGTDTRVDDVAFLRQLVAQAMRDLDLDPKRL